MPLIEWQEQQLMTLARKNFADLASLLLIHFTSRKTPQYTFQVLHEDTPCLKGICHVAHSHLCLCPHESSGEP